MAEFVNECGPVKVELDAIQVHIYNWRFMCVYLTGCATDRTTDRASTSITRTYYIIQHVLSLGLATHLHDG